jgi:hypothetical protein
MRFVVEAARSVSSTCVVGLIRLSECICYDVMRLLVACDVQETPAEVHETGCSWDVIGSGPTTGCSGYVAADDPVDRRLATSTSSSFHPSVSTSRTVSRSTSSPSPGAWHRPASAVDFEKAQPSSSSAACRRRRQLWSRQRRSQQQLQQRSSSGTLDDNPLLLTPDYNEPVGPSSRSRRQPVVTQRSLPEMTMSPQCCRVDESPSEIPAAVEPSSAGIGSSVLLSREAAVPCRVRLLDGDEFRVEVPVGFVFGFDIFCTSPAMAGRPGKVRQMARVAPLQWYGE